MSYNQEIVDSISEEKLKGLLLKNKFVLEEKNVDLTNNNQYRQAIVYYFAERNERERLFKIIETLEHVFRNSLHTVIRNKYKNSNWLTEVSHSAMNSNIYKDFKNRLDHETFGSFYYTLSKEKKNLVRAKYTVTEGQLVAKLTFGFWVRLLRDSKYQPLYDDIDILLAVFKNEDNPEKRKNLNNQIKEVVDERNRIFHGEMPNMKPTTLVKTCKSLLEAISKDTFDLVQSHFDF